MGFDRVLVANRGEIACRVIRSARSMGLSTVAVYSDADVGAPHVGMADMAVRIGAAPAGESYLDGEAVLRAAQETGAGAVHPGYGFLSENAEFAQAVADAGMLFVGPPAEAIEAMGDKAAAKRVMEEAGIPCVPGYHGAEQTDKRLVEEGERIGFPLMVKAAAGGGGKGMRLVSDAAELPEALERARSEGRAAFGSDALILEKAIVKARHVEIQVFADAHGSCIHLGERDCSVQRRHQKVIEEAPAPGMSDALRAEMGEAAVRAAEAVGYVGAGTVEFLLDDEGFYFLEMNTRLQVEHPVTEMVTGLDLVEMQLRVAQGEALEMTQADVRFEGHAIEARLYAEDAANGFLPATGRIAHWQAGKSEGIRVDAGIESGSEVTPYYDPMLAKVIAWGADREEARVRLLEALQESACLGVTTNTGFLSVVLQDAAFVQGGVTTGYLDEAFAAGVEAGGMASEEIAAAVALILWQEVRAARAVSLMADDLMIGFASDGGRFIPVDLDGFAAGIRVVGPKEWVVCGDGWEHVVHLERIDGARAGLRIDGRRKVVWFAGDGKGGLYLQCGAVARHVERQVPGGGNVDLALDGAVIAPMPGQVVALDVAEGDRVEQGQRLAVLEAMKMQHQLVADMAGVVESVQVAQGGQVTGGQVIVVIGEEKA
ncbi:acetyl-CoA carboxylase biotin carboxylase subunit [Alisedimentitalea sp. MJ-SS2]|uniref:acetyl/propionyl/methylcrotonyl-CoA carboxylase subunit alpha n=1 Tax=Aliisedimentitalea sp. MJ-SS2 TaxID=3049795 RepID=UPI00290F0D0D|nr:acetyl-CoA carboxylase biotin carboxylase subunit [Alisedimentitalea sp. MJ-SS2]MDU8929232.1 acetyl-CoA carboxylase biotin carboxylase subunit [Alisedimentitalea sp. MJ-SS2]